MCWPGTFSAHFGWIKSSSPLFINSTRFLVLCYVVLLYFVLGLLFTYPRKKFTSCKNILSLFSWYDGCEKHLQMFFSNFFSCSVQVVSAMCDKMYLSEVGFFIRSVVYYGLCLSRDTRNKRDLSEVTLRKNCEQKEKVCVMRIFFANLSSTAFSLTFFFRCCCLFVLSLCLYPVPVSPSIMVLTFFSSCKRWLVLIFLPSLQYLSDPIKFLLLCRFCEFISYFSSLIPRLGNIVGY